MSVAPTGRALVLSGPNPHSLNAANAKTTMTSPNNKMPTSLPPGFIGTPKDVTNRKNGKEDRGYRVMSE